MKTGAHHILGKRILDLDAGGFHKARDQMIRADAPFCLQLLQRSKAPPPGLNGELTGLNISLVDHGTDGERLQEPTTRDVLRKIVNAEGSANLPDIGSRRDELGKRNLAREASAPAMKREAVGLEANWVISVISTTARAEPLSSPFKPSQTAQNHLFLRQRTNGRKPRQFRGNRQCMI